MAEFRNKNNETYGIVWHFIRIVRTFGKELTQTPPPFPNICG